jgi:hypothetical protein
MRSRLLENRHGRLTTDQWKDMVTEPLVMLLLLLTPAVILLGPRLAFAFRTLGILVGIVIFVVIVPMGFRAWRYARAPVQFARLYASDNPLASRFLFWRPQILYTESGKPVKFKKRLAPMTGLHANHAYLVYYLRESDHNVLLSLAPAQHPDAEKWQPSEKYYARYARRT